MNYKVLFVKFLIFGSLMVICEAGKKRNKIAPSKQLLYSRETNPLSFIALFFMRLFYGISKVFGFDVSEWFGGALVPPGAEDADDYDDFDLR